MKNERSDEIDNHKVDGNPDDGTDEITRQELDAAVQNLRKRMENPSGTVYVRRRCLNPLLHKD